MALFAGRRSGKSSTEEKLPSRGALAKLTKGDPSQRSLGNYAKRVPGIEDATMTGVGLNTPDPLPSGVPDWR